MNVFLMPNERRLPFLCLSIFCFASLGGCADHTTDRGASSINELCSNYAAAHKSGDLQQAARLFAVYNGRPLPADENAGLIAKSINDLLMFPLDEVFFSEVKGGPGTHMSYQWTENVYGRRKRDGFIGPTRGRLILVRDDSDRGDLPVRLDPGLIIAGGDGRYFIHVSVGVLMDAGQAVREGRAPHSKFIEK